MVFVSIEGFVVKIWYYYLLINRIDFSCQFLLTLRQLQEYFLVLKILCVLRHFSSNGNLHHVLHYNFFYLFSDWIPHRLKIPFPSGKNSHFQNQAKSKTFLVKMSFIWMRTKNHFHISSFALSLALKQRLAAAGKWPIDLFTDTAAIFWINSI